MPGCFLLQQVWCKRARGGRTQRELRRGQLTVDDVEVGPADTAGAHAHQHLAGPGLGPRRVFTAYL